MDFTSFEIENFKGIAKCQIDLKNPSEKSLVITLIGLNESGKTTVLEALANFIGRDDQLPLIIGTQQSKPQARDWVPKSQKANFNGKIKFTATVSLNAEDKLAIANEILQKHNNKADISKIPSSFEISKEIRFKNSEPQQTVNLWDISFWVKPKTGRKFRVLGDGEADKPIWQTGIKPLQNSMPRISYFPNFLFDLPERICLEPSGNKNDLGKYYCDVFQDIMDSQGENLNVQTHILDRAAKYRQDEFKKDNREQIDSVFRKVAAELNRTISVAWSEIFGTHANERKLEIDWNFDTENENKISFQFSILERDDKYSINERSLGFRWFFCFLLFTLFGTGRGSKRKTYFLFDEPASNLHALAQMRLLESFPRIAGDHNTIIYSTHSHYMIEPRWLERAYIVVNSAIDFGKGEFEINSSDRKSNITLEKYRTFVNRYPQRVSYFQPILDRLQYAVSPLVGSQPSLIVEGKHDFAAMRYFLPQLDCSAIDIIPGVGAGKHDVLISLFIGWGRRFLVLLDDDPAGRLEKERYLTDFFLPENSIATLGDICASLKGKKLEGLLSNEYCEFIRTERELANKPSKKEISRFFQERIASNPMDNLHGIDSKTRETMQLVSDFVNKRLLL